MYLTALFNIFSSYVHILEFWCVCSFLPAFALEICILLFQQNHYCIYFLFSLSFSYLPITHQIIQTIQNSYQVPLKSGIDMLFFPCTVIYFFLPCHGSLWGYQREKNFFLLDRKGWFNSQTNPIQRALLFLSDLQLGWLHYTFTTVKSSVSNILFEYLSVMVRDRSDILLMLNPLKSFIKSN